MTHGDDSICCYAITGAGDCWRVGGRPPCRAGLRFTAGAIVILAGLFVSGCRSGLYSAAELPQQLQAPLPSQGSQRINLSRMAAPGAGTSQIGPGDLLEVTIASGGDNEMPGPVPTRVGRDGVVQVPLIGPVAVGGIEPVEAEQLIAAAAVERGVYRQPYVTLSVVEPAVNRVTVLGAVTNPGVVELPRGSSNVLSALAAAGGLTDKAGTEVDVLRQGGGSFMASGPHGVLGQSPDSPGGVRLASYQAAASGYAADPSRLAALPAPHSTRIDLAQLDQAERVNSELGDRDVVMVLPQDKRVIHVTGLVYKPDQFELDPTRDIRLLDAVAMAGGTKSPLADKVVVIRQFPEMPEPAIVQLSLAKAKRDGRENLRLAPGDLVSVEATPTTMVFDTASNFFRVAIGLSGNLATF